MSAQCDILITNCAMFDEEWQVVQNQSVTVSKGLISAVGRDLTGYRAAETINAENKLLLPGFVDGHTHVCQQLLRGRVTDEYPMVWSRILVPFESSLTADDVRVSARLACLEMIKAGITAFADSGGVYMEEVAQTAADSGMRAVLARSTMDMGAGIPDSMKESRAEHMRRTEELYNAWDGKADGRVNIWYGLRQVMTCSAELIKETALRARDKKTGIHAHLCEHKDEVSFCLQNYKRRPAEFLDDCGALGSDLLTAHNVTLSESDITLLAKRGVKMIHCPQANLTNHGFPKTPRILEAGCTVGIGNDGAAAVALDMFEQMRILKSGVTAYWGLPVFDPAALPTAALLKMASQGGAAAIGKEGQLGKVLPGWKADLILIDLRQPHLYPSRNISHTLVACGSGRDVTDSIIDGRVVMRDRKVLTLDEDKILADGAVRMDNIARRAGI